MTKIIISESLAEELKALEDGLRGIRAKPGEVSSLSQRIPRMGLNSEVGEDDGKVLIDHPDSDSGDDEGELKWVTT